MSRHTQRSTHLKTLSIKVPSSLSARVSRLARARGSTVSAIVREALEQYAPSEGTSFATAARAYIGSVAGGPGDLSTNPKHLAGFGK
ncbi:MAG: CopG family transcriptional regulator [Myxococcales bacterium]|nr:CopG family transcriptional regulator [Myxococcales bacterium]